MRPPPTPLKFGYGTNGFTHHRLADVLVVLVQLIQNVGNYIARKVDHRQTQS